MSEHNRNTAEISIYLKYYVSRLIEVVYKTVPCILAFSYSSSLSMFTPESFISNIVTIIFPGMVQDWMLSLMFPSGWV